MAALSTVEYGSRGSSVVSTVSIYTKADDIWLAIPYSNKEKGWTESGQLLIVGFELNKYRFGVTVEAQAEWRITNVIAVKEENIHGEAAMQSCASTCMWEQGREQGEDGWLEAGVVRVHRGEDTATSRRGQTRGEARGLGCPRATNMKTNSSVPACNSEDWQDTPTSEDRRQQGVMLAYHIDILHVKKWAHVYILVWQDDMHT